MLRLGQPHLVGQLVVGLFAPAGRRWKPLLSVGLERHLPLWVRLAASGVCCRHHIVGHHSSLSTCSYTRNVSISNNDFEWLGQSAVASWGRAVLNDGTNGEFPRFTVLSSNWAHDLGIIQKQSSFYFQAETAEASDFPIMNSFFCGSCLIVDWYLLPWAATGDTRREHRL
jgi:hypothetical protein